MVGKAIVGQSRYLLHLEFVAMFEICSESDQSSGRWVLSRGRAARDYPRYADGQTQKTQALGLSEGKGLGCRPLRVWLDGLG